MNDYLSYWDVPAEEAPAITGAASVMDLSDIRDVLDHFTLDLSRICVVDVGCGTGRLADACGDYWGFDIAPGMVKYARQRGRRAALIGDLADFSNTVSLVACLSVFTHIHRADRQAYLTRFADIAPAVLADILPGAEEGNPRAWYANTDSFESDLATAGFGNFDTYERVAPSGHLHRYYHARQ